MDTSYNNRTYMVKQKSKFNTTSKHTILKHTKAKHFLTLLRVATLTALASIAHGLKDVFGSNQLYIRKIVNGSWHSCQ